MQTSRYPPSLPSHKIRLYRLQNNDYALVGGVLFKRNLNGVLLRCVSQEQAKKILHECHNGRARRHFFEKTTAIKIMCVGYFWSNMFNESPSLVRLYKECQCFVGKRKNLAMPLNPIMVDEPFTQWGLDFIGMINLYSSARQK